MSWRLKKIKIENFKYFHQEFSLEVGSRNLLIYGENGSGKSSIYWSLYTLFQSRLKPDEASVEKYFDPTNDENLRNKYSQPSDVSKVEVTFEDKANPLAVDKSYVISLDNVNTQQTTDVFLDFTVSSSDFLNYKMLSKLTDKDNSVINDVTDMFVKEIYPFAEFQTEYTKLDGTPSGTRNAMVWHKYIQTSVDQVERQRGRRRNHFDKTGIKYGRYKTLLQDFRNQLSLYLAELSIRATNKLKNEFNVKDVKVSFETDASYDFDLPTSPRYRDHKLHPLHIRLNAKLKNTQLAGGEADIVHMRTFFNEAKLTCIGLAIRMAVVDMKFAGGGNYASILCMDDVLLSLDMSYREPVTEAILRYAQNYQVCLFTHDRLLYNMIQGKVKELGYTKDEWLYLEFYQSDPSKEGVEEPSVNYLENKGYEAKVKSYLLQGDYPAAGNYLRKYAESLIKAILPLNFCYRVKDDGSAIVPLMLRGLYDETVRNGDENFCGLYELSTTAMPDISKHLSRLMNPLSHDDKDMPIYRRELELALAEVVKYKPIADAKKIIVKCKDAETKLFKMEMTNGTDIRIVEFVAIDQWDYFDFPAPTGRKYKNCEVMIKSSTDLSFAVGNKMRVKDLYKRLRKRVFPGASGAAPSFDFAISEVTTGMSLSMM